MKGGCVVQVSCGRELGQGPARGGARNPETEHGRRIYGAISDNHRGQVIRPDMGFPDPRVPTTRLSTGKKHP
jgi:hypothetical protein